MKDAFVEQQEQREQEKASTTEEAPKEEAKPGDEKETEAADPDKKEDDSKGEVNLESLREHLPEGFELDAERATPFMEALNDDKLSRTELAQKLTGLYAEEVRHISETIAADNQRSFIAMTKEWREETLKEFGTKADDKLERIDMSIKEFDEAMKASTQVNGQAPEFGDEFREALRITGAGTNPAILRYLAWMGEQLTEGKPLGGQPSHGTQSREDRMFGSR